MSDSELSFSYCSGSPASRLSPTDFARLRTRRLCASACYQHRAAGSAYGAKEGEEWVFLRSKDADLR
jgi:hypothetical protein